MHFDRRLGIAALILGILGVAFPLLWPDLAPILGFACLCFAVVLAVWWAIVEAKSLVQRGPSNMMTLLYCVILGASVGAASGAILWVGARRLKTTPPVTASPPPKETTAANATPDLPFIVFLYKDHRLEINNTGQAEFLLWGTKLGDGPPEIEKEPRVVPRLPYNYFLYGDRLEPFITQLMGPSPTIQVPLLLYAETKGIKFVTTCLIYARQVDGKLMIDTQNLGSQVGGWPGMPSPPVPSWKQGVSDVELRFVYTERPALVIVNRSGVVAKDIKWMVAVWNLDLPDRTDPLPIPVQTFDWIPANNEGGPQDLFNGPTVAPLAKTGDRLFGSASVNCPDCFKGRTYVVHIILGSGGWFAEVETEKLGVVLIPPKFTKSDLAAYFATLEADVPVASRIQIKPTR
jgi:hypothetical protein